MNDHVGVLSAEQPAGLRRAVDCPILTGSDNEYDQVRRIWNGMIDRKPSVIVRPSSIAGVMQSVRFAREHNLPVCVRGGGHGVAGKSVAEGSRLQMGANPNTIGA
jgi:FAD/FMN-containing dehydrogenase